MSTTKFQRCPSTHPGTNNQCTRSVEHDYSLGHTTDPADPEAVWFADERFCKVHNEVYCLSDQCPECGAPPCCPEDVNCRAAAEALTEAFDKAWAARVGN